MTLDMFSCTRLNKNDEGRDFYLLKRRGGMFNVLPVLVLSIEGSFEWLSVDRQNVFLFLAC